MFSRSLFAAVCIAIAPQVQAASWNLEQVDQLEQWVRKAPEDALPILDCSDLETARRSGDASAIDDVATGLALDLARIHLLGAATRAERAKWDITDTDESTDLESWLERALAANSVGTFFEALRPSHPDYAALRGAYAKASDPDDKLTLARNMERWRWLPRSLGQDFVLVNIAKFEAQLWQNGSRTGTWRVITGKTTTPTPVFSTRITGVILNPWWNIPASIVREMRGRFPASRGYVRQNGRWRQRPGPGNALGLMKLVMPNRYTVFMHDTPTKDLFEREVRAFSHGCIRTGDALGYAAALLAGVKTREEIDAIVASRKTTQIDLPAAVPLYVAYFTAAPREDGTVAILPDIYKRDGAVRDHTGSGRACGA